MSLDDVAGVSVPLLLLDEDDDGTELDAFDLDVSVVGADGVVGVTSASAEK